MINQLLNLNPKLLKIVKIYDQSVHGSINYTNFWSYTQNYTLTITIIKSNHGKIFGAFSPKKWENLGQAATNVTNGNCFIQYYDEEKIRICHSKK